MLVTRHVLQETVNARAALLVIAVCMIVFWKATLRILLGTVILATVVGTLVLLHDIK